MSNSIRESKLYLFPRAARWFRHVLALFVFAWMAAATVDAHEGHAPLPTKGVLVDVEAGKLVLTPDAHRALDVETVEVSLRPQDESVLAYATIQTPWRQHAFVGSQIEGRIEGLHVQPGEWVEAGTVLGQMRSLELERLQIDLLTAENERRLSEKTLAQSEPLAEMGVIAAQQVIEQRLRHRTNENSVRLARAKLLGLGFSDGEVERLINEGRGALISLLPIRAPIGGTMIHADVSVGQVVPSNQHLFEIVDHSSVWARIEVLERDLSKVEAHQPVALTLAAYPEETFSSTIAIMGSALDATTHLGIAWAELENPANGEPRFLPGMRGQARISVGGTEARLAVPAVAVLGDGPEKFVLVEEGATARAFEYRRVSVVIAGRSAEMVFLAGGDVFPGDIVVTTGGHELASSFIQGVLRPSPEASRTIGLQVEPARRHVVEETLEVDGRIELPPGGRAFAAAGVAGTLRSIRVDRGQQVAPGEILAEITSLEFQNLQLDLLRARLDEELAHDTAERLRPLGGEAVAARRLWEVESAEQSARDRRESAHRSLKALGITESEIDTLLTTRKPLPGLPVRAPIAGVITDFTAALGQFVSADEPVFEIHDLSKVWVRGYFSESDLARVQIGQPARVRLVAMPEFVGEATIIRSGRNLGETDRTLSAWAEFEVPPEFSPRQNMLARLTLVMGSADAVLAVPPEAIVREGTRTYLFVREPDGTFARRLIETGRASDTFVEIASGLQPGALVAIRGAVGLQNAFITVR